MRGLEFHRPQVVEFDHEQSTATYGVFTAQPFERGWGVTVGNALRRILLSSIEGAAITAVRFAGVAHELDSIPGVLEDVIDLILNLKKVPLRLSGVERTTATIAFQGPGELRAEAIRGGAELEVVNPQVYLATLSEEGRVEAELHIQRGRGYAPAMEQSDRGLGVGTIYVDAAFSPVRKANFRLEPARVGQATDYEKLILEVWTNGAITPQEAVAQAATLLTDHLAIFTNVASATSSPGAGTSLLDSDLTRLELPKRVETALRNAGIVKVRELLAMSEEELAQIPGLGKQALAAVKKAVEGAGLALGMSLEPPVRS